MAPIDITLVLTNSDSNLPPEDSLPIMDKSHAPKVSFIWRLHCIATHDQECYLPTQLPENQSGSVGAWGWGVRWGGGGRMSHSLLLCYDILLIDCDY